MSFIAIGILVFVTLAFVWIFQGLYRLWKDWRNTKLENVLVENRNQGDR